MNTENGINVLKCMKSKIPVFALTVNQAIITHLYGNCNNNKLNTIFWAYMPILIFLSGIWEFFFMYFRLVNKNHINLNKNDYILSWSENLAFGIWHGG